MTKSTKRKYMRVKSDRFQLYNMEYFIQFMLHIGACSSVIHTVVDQSVRNGYNTFRKSTE